MVILNTLEGCHCSKPNTIGGWTVCHHVRGDVSKVPGGIDLSVPYHGLIFAFEHGIQKVATFTDTGAHLEQVKLQNFDKGVQGRLRIQFCARGLACSKGFLLCTQIRFLLL